MEEISFLVEYHFHKRAMEYNGLIIIDISTVLIEGVESMYGDWYYV